VEEQVKGQGGPHHATARPGGGPRHHMVWWHGGSPWVAPGASLPHFKHKNLIKFFGIFRETLFSGNSQNLINDYKTEKRLWNDGKQIQNQIYRSSKILYYAIN